MASTAQVTDFSRDVPGRFVCNSLPEALAGTDSAARPGARPFDVIVASGGSFGGVFAQHLQERLGHSTIGITLDVYSHVMPSMETDDADRVAALILVMTAKITTELAHSSGA